MFFTISGGAMVMLSWKDLVVPMVGCHLASRSRKRGPRGDLAQVILCKVLILRALLGHTVKSYLKHLFDV